MNRQQFFNNLQLDNHNIFNKQIKPISFSVMPFLRVQNQAFTAEDAEERKENRKNRA